MLAITTWLVGCLGGLLRSTQIGFQNGCVLRGQGLVRKLGTIVLARRVEALFGAHVRALKLHQGAGFVGLRPPAGLAQMRVVAHGHGGALPVHQQCVVGGEEVLRAREVGAHHVQAVLQGLDQGAAKALAAVQREVAVGALVQVGELARGQGVFDELDAWVWGYPCERIAPHVLPTAHFQKQVSGGMSGCKFQKHPQHRLRIFTGHGGVQVKHEQADKGLGRHFVLFAKFAPRGRVLHHGQGQRQGELTRLGKEGLLHKTGGAPNVVDQLQRRGELARKVRQLPQKVAHASLGLTEELGVKAREFLALHGGHEEDAGLVVVGGELFPTHIDLALRVGGHVGDRESNAKVVEHGCKGPKVFTQAHGGGGVSDEVKALGRLQHVQMIIVRHMRLRLNLTMKLGVA